MAEAITVSISGVEEVNATLRKVVDTLGEMTDANRQLSSEIAAKASAIAPRRTGRLASSITGKVDGKAATISANTPYAGVIEYGWPARNIPEQSYLRRAATESATPVVVYEEHIKNTIKKYNLD